MAIKDLLQVSDYESNAESEIDERFSTINK